MALPVLIEASRRPIPVTIKSRRVELDAMLRRVVNSKLSAALGRFSWRVRKAFVWIEDTNGPREGSGIRCRIDLTLVSGGRLSVSADAPNEFAAVALGAERARATLDRHVKKRRHVKRRSRTLRSPA